jgi:hypothetical protein
MEQIATSHARFGSRNIQNRPGATARTSPSVRLRTFLKGSMTAPRSPIGRRFA